MSIIVVLLVERSEDKSCRLSYAIDVNRNGRVRDRTAMRGQLKND